MEKTNEVLSELFVIINEKFTNSYFEKLEEEFSNIDSYDESEKIKIFFEKMSFFSTVDMVNFAKFCSENSENKDLNEDKMVDLLSEWISKTK
jgi:hypothetical protein